MKLMTKELARRLPTLYSTASIPVSNKIAQGKFFDPCGRFTCYIIEFDGLDTLFGYTVSSLDSDCDGWGYTSLSELQTTRNPLGLGIERDINFTPTVMSKILDAK